MKDRFLTKLFDKQRKVMVIGAGISGRAACELLLKRGVSTTLYDDKNNIDLPDHLRLNPLLTTCFAEENFRISADISALILSPGIPPAHPVVVQAQRLGLPLLSEIDLAFLFLPNVKIIGISGTNGKSSTTAMVKSIFDAAGIGALAGGNLGIPPCQMLNEGKLEGVEFLVLELSSFQLETIACAKLDAGLLINITPDHLDRYQTFDKYLAAKRQIATLLKPDAPLFINPNLAPHFVDDHHIKICEFDLTERTYSSQHNPENVAAAAALTGYFGITREEISAGITAFKSLPHRFERLGEKLGVTFINDSKATTVASVLQALKNIATPVHLLLGGLAKGESFAPLKDAVNKNIAHFYVFGHSKTQIASELEASPLTLHADLAESMAAASKNAHAGHTILLSPGCASYDQFNNFAERGDMFKNIFFNMQG